MLSTKVGGREMLIKILFKIGKCLCVFYSILKYFNARCHAPERHLNNELFRTKLNLKKNYFPLLSLTNKCIEITDKKKEAQ